MQPTIPHLTRSLLHRCLQRHGIGRLPNVEGNKPAKKKFKAYPIGYFHIDVADVRTEQGKIDMFVAIDRTSKFAVVELYKKATITVAREFLLRLIAAVPYKIHTVLTDNGIQFTTPSAGGSAVPLIREAIANGERFRAHAFEYTCAKADIEHCTTRAKHPWTNGQVERMNRTIKDATVKRFYYESQDQLQKHLASFIAAYNARRLKTLKGASRPTSSSARHASPSLSASQTIRSTKSRDQTSSWRWFGLRGRDERPIFAFPGIWRRYQGPVRIDGPKVALEVYAFLTTTPNELVATINHERMPILLTREDEFEAWLSGAPADALPLAREYPPGPMRIVQEGFKKQDMLAVAA